LKNLELVISRLSNLKSKKYKHTFAVPGLWINQPPGKIEINPFEYFLERINKIKSLSDNINIKSELSVYNMFIRLTAAYDHNSDSKLESEKSMFRETGTFLKAIALLPYIHSLGVNTIYLLPVTAIGEDEKKGNLGSPYAIRNPYQPDENLSEPLLGLDVETEFKAFAEAVHLLGMKLVCEFVFRTSSIDSDLSLEHPEWFYWIHTKIKNRAEGETYESKYGPPIFMKKELEAIKLKVESGDLINLIPPHEQHIKMFTESPKKVARVDGKIRGLISDKKVDVKIPGAFADWPPDDNQPAWTDVTFLKLYDNPKFNYIAYNTIRMYDKELAKPEFEVKELWDYIAGIIPHYIESFGIDGVMIDMGHALPAALRTKIVESAVLKKPDFFFWEENFLLTEQSVKEGYSAVLGYLPFDAHRAEKMRDLLARISHGDVPVNFFATSESHNTPRTFGRISDIRFLKIIYAISAFLPAITFIHSGFEIAEENPVNTGLDFTPDEISRFPAEKLGLFSAVELNWDNENEITDFIRQINKVKGENLTLPDNIRNHSIFPVNCHSENIVSFMRRDSASQTEIIIMANYSSKSLHNCSFDIYAGAERLKNLLFDEEINTHEGKFKLNFEPYELKIFKVIY